MQCYSICNRLSGIIRLGLRELKLNEEATLTYKWDAPFGHYNDIGLDML